MLPSIMSLPSEPEGAGDMGHGEHGGRAQGTEDRPQGTRGVQGTQRAWRTWGLGCKWRQYDKKRGQGQRRELKVFKKASATRKRVRGMSCVWCLPVN